MAETRSKQPDHWLALESPSSGGSWGCRIESVGVKLPAGRLTTKDLMNRTNHRTRIQLERLTGIHERHVVGPGENSFTLAAGAARDCLAHSQHQASDIEMLISTSITRSKGRYSQSFEPPLSLYIKQAIGATQAVNFDLSNACAGMLTGVFVLQDLITRGEISCGMVVSGEYISHLSWNAAQQIRSLFSKQLASLTLGDAGAAVIVERAPSGSGHRRHRLHHPRRAQPAVPRLPQHRRPGRSDVHQIQEAAQGGDRGHGAAGRRGDRRSRNRPGRHRLPDPASDLGPGHPHRAPRNSPGASAPSRSTWSSTWRSTATRRRQRCSWHSTSTSRSSGSTRETG